MDEPRNRILPTPFLTRAARWGIVSWSVIGVLILAGILFRYVLSPISIVFPPLLLAMVIVYMLNPFVTALQRRHVPRVWGALLSYVVFFTVVGFALNALIPSIAGQVSVFARSVPTLLDRAQESVVELASRMNFRLQIADLFQNLEPGRVGGEFIQRIFSFTAGVVHVALVGVLGAILGFYLLVDLPKIQRGIHAMVPTGRRWEVESLLEAMGRALGGFFRGQLLVALFVGLMSMLGLYVVGLPYWALVGLVAGVFNLIPLVGPFIGAVPALFIAFTTPTSAGLLQLDPGWPLAFGAAIALVSVQQLDNHIISPNIVARTVKLHPVTVLLGLLVGGTLLGLWGMLLAVPAIAAVKILILHYWDTRVQWPPQPPQTVVAPVTTPPGDAPPSEPDGAVKNGGARRVRLPSMRWPQVLRRSRSGET